MLRELNDSSDDSKCTNYQFSFIDKDVREEKLRMFKELKESMNELKMPQIRIKRK